jgi:hypothetical protein
MCASAITPEPGIPHGRGEMPAINCKVFINGREIEPEAQQWDQTMKDLILPLFKHSAAQGQSPDLVIRAEHLKPGELETIDHGKQVNVSQQFEKEAVKTLQTLKETFEKPGGEKRGAYEMEIRISAAAPQPKEAKKATVEDDIEAWMKETEELIATGPAVEGLEIEEIIPYSEEETEALMAEIKQTINSLHSLVEAVESQEAQPAVSAQAKKQYGTTLKQIEGQLVSAQDTIRKLEKKVETLTEKSARLQDKLRGEKKGAGVEKELQELKMKREELDETINKQNGEITRLKRELKTAKEKNEVLTEGANLMTVEKDAKIQYLEEKIKSDQQELQKHTGVEQGTEKTFKAKDAEIKSLQEELASVHGQLQFYNNAFGEAGLEGFVDSTTKLQQENERFHQLLQLMSKDEQLGPAMAAFLQRLPLA